MLTPIDLVGSKSTISVLFQVERKIIHRMKCTGKNWNVEGSSEYIHYDYSIFHIPIISHTSISIQYYFCIFIVDEVIWQKKKKRRTQFIVCTFWTINIVFEMLLIIQLTSEELFEVDTEKKKLL